MGKFPRKGAPPSHCRRFHPTTFGPLLDLYGSRCGIFMDNWTSTHARRSRACSGDGNHGWDGIGIYIWDGCRGLIHSRLNNRGGHSFILAPMQINLDIERYIIKIGYTGINQPLPRRHIKWKT